MFTHNNGTSFFKMKFRPEPHLAKWNSGKNCMFPNEILKLSSEHGSWYLVTDTPVFLVDFWNLLLGLWPTQYWNFILKNEIPAGTSFPKMKFRRQLTFYKMKCWSDRRQCFLYFSSNSLASVACYKTNWNPDKNFSRQEHSEHVNSQTTHQPRRDLYRRVFIHPETCTETHTEITSLDPTRLQQQTSFQNHSQTTATIYTQTFVKHLQKSTHTISPPRQHNNREAPYPATRPPHPPREADQDEHGNSKPRTDPTVRTDITNKP